MDKEGLIEFLKNALKLTEREADDKVVEDVPEYLFGKGYCTKKFDKNGKAFYQILLHGRLTADEQCRTIAQNSESLTEQVECPSPPEVADPTAETVKKKKPRLKKKLPSLDDLIPNLPPYPTDEKENHEWVSQDRFKRPCPRSLNTMRSRPGSSCREVTCGVVGQDSSGRVYWKPDSDSQKVFYCRKYLTGDKYNPPKNPATSSSKRKK